MPGRSRTTANEMADFDALVARLQFRDIRLIGKRISLPTEVLDLPPEGVGTITYSLGFASTARLRLDQAVVFCVLTWQWRASIDALPPVEVDETYQLQYSISGSESVAQSVLQFFSDENAAHNAWPFFRQSMHATTMQMGLPGLVLPLLKPKRD